MHLWDIRILITPDWGGQFFCITGQKALLPSPLQRDYRSQAHFAFFPSKRYPAKLLCNVCQARLVHILVCSLLEAHVLQIVFKSAASGTF